MFINMEKDWKRTQNDSKERKHPKWPANEPQKYEMEDGKCMKRMQYDKKGTRMIHNKQDDTK